MTTTTQHEKQFQIYNVPVIEAMGLKGLYLKSLKKKHPKDKPSDILYNAFIRFVWMADYRTGNFNATIDTCSIEFGWHSRKRALYLKELIRLGALVTAGENRYGIIYNIPLYDKIVTIPKVSVPVPVTKPIVEPQDQILFSPELPPEANESSNFIMAGNVEIKTKAANTKSRRKKAKQAKKPKELPVVLPVHWSKFRAFLIDVWIPGYPKTANPFAFATEVDKFIETRLDWTQVQSIEILKKIKAHSKWYIANSKDGDNFKFMLGPVNYLRNGKFNEPVTVMVNTKKGGGINKNVSNDTDYGTAEERNKILGNKTTTTI